MTDYERKRERILEFIDRRTRERTPAGTKGGGHFDQVRETGQFHGSRIGTVIVCGDNSTINITTPAAGLEADQEAEEEDDPCSSPAELVKLCRSLVDQVTRLRSEMEAAVQPLVKSISPGVQASQTICPARSNPAIPCVAPRSRAAGTPGRSRRRYVPDSTTSFPPVPASPRQIPHPSPLLNPHVPAHDI